MGREQHYAGLHYRSKYQIGATHTSYDEDDYYDGSKKEFQFNHPRTSINHPILHRSSNIRFTMLCLSH